MTKTLRQLIIEYGDARADIGYNSLALAVAEGDALKLHRKQHQKAVAEASKALVEINKLIG